jgi:phosphoribosylglycinamide formyltransferase-1
MKPYRIAIFASGSGSNAEAICRYFKNHPSIEVSIILTNNSKAGVLARAHKLSIETLIFDKEEFQAEKKVQTILVIKQITHVVLAGFLWLVPPFLIRMFPNKIINIHPALLPKFGGKGMYGLRVHEAVKNAGEKETGITIHLVNEHFDEGKPVFQATCPVETNDSATDIAANVLALEHSHYPRVIEEWIVNS